MTLYVPAKEFEGELWVKAADFQKAISEAEGRSIAEAEQQEPVYLVWMKEHRAWRATGKDGFDKTPEEYRWLLYTHPPKREWVGLTQQDIDIAFDDTQEGGGFNEFARAIEAKLKEKNT